MTLCPCNSAKEFEQCCAPYLDGTAKPETAEALMRSRYTAYAREDYPYVIATCHESNRPTPEDFEDEVEITWTGLEILETDLGGADDEEGIVEFIAKYRSKGNDYSLRERSSFVRVEGTWFYQDGQIIRLPVRSDKIGRNDPCPCGSGKKHKKCCLGKGAV
ncbi:MAG: SEC-C domain-containing protein [Proteobacteria bacterium]|nr:SEC-C domain-containing protein [Pseudomonadota bacterium]MBU1687800.1 SEC-C domain-containing protein [Pseudomonadota bacterium]